MTQTFAIDIGGPASIPLTGADSTFPINRIFCVGRNYAAHAREMGANPDREPPFFFSKPADAVLTGSTCTMPYPPMTHDMHHEVELVIGLKKGGRDIAPDDALSHIYGVALGLDFTRRDMQAEAKKTGRPWDMSKGFDASAIIGEMLPVMGQDVPQTGTIALSVNDVLAQKGDLSDMIWSIPEVIAELSRYLTLRPGDLIFTGTPEGVGPVVKGDVLKASLEGVPDLTVLIA
ncbi:MAG: fumarylacetoacetate hydrolase family protein [Cohaesibacter sp.]|jgi:fumarylpyruvate hydrolase|nr:fumarylacetoacetate hydrolase family protein [Cohaesibacter sp.]